MLQLRSQSTVLLRSGAFSARKNKDGDTALHVASNQQVADLAIQGGAVCPFESFFFALQQIEWIADNGR